MTFTPTRRSYMSTVAALIALIAMLAAVLVAPVSARASVTSDVPGAPAQVSAAPTARGALTVTWTMPETDGGSAITGYTVTLLPESRSVDVGPDVRSYTFTALGDDEEHTFEVRAKSAFGTGEPKQYYWPTRTWGVPEVPIIGAVTPNRTTVDVRWSWNPPTGPLPDFIVTAHPSKRTMSVPYPVGSRSAKATFTGLDQDGAHSFTVAARNVVGSSGESEMSETVRMVSQPQAPVLGGEVRSNGDVLVHWGKPLGYDNINVYEACQHRGDGAVVQCAHTRYGDMTFTDTRAGGTYRYSVRARDEFGYGPRSNLLALTTAAGVGAGYTPLDPRRVLDTRTGTGAAKRQVTAGESLMLTVSGVPVGARSVTLNLTATGSTMATHVIAHAAGTTRPSASHLNVVPGETVASLVTVPISSDGRVSLYNNRGRVHLIADLAGYTAATGGSVLMPTASQRVVDTRTGVGSFQRRVGPGESIVFHAGTSAVYRPTAAVVNITATGATRATYLVAYPRSSGRPTASTVNVAAGGTVANLAVVQLDADGSAEVTNDSGYVDIIVDLVGVYSADTGVGFTDVSPTRVVDTRIGMGAVARVGTTPTSVTLPAVPAGAKAVVLRTTVVDPSRAGNLMTYPQHVLSGSSTLNFVTGKTVGNSTVVPIGPDGIVRFSASSGVQTHLVVDVAGYYLR